MDAVTKEIINISKSIDGNIEMGDVMHRGILSNNVLQHLRHLVEAVSLKAYNTDKNMGLAPDYTHYRDSMDYMKEKSHLNFIEHFHKILQASVSHYSIDPLLSERLMLKYYVHLQQLKDFVYDQYELVILERLHEFPFVEDTTHLAYYKEIVSKLVEPTEVNYRFINERYYIHKTRPFYVEGKMYYEVTYTLASDNVSKFDRHIAFTEHSLLENYALELSLRKEAIHIMGTTMPVDIIEDWRVSIRPCELNHFSRIFGEPINIQKGYKEYINLMNYLTNKRQNLLQIMEYDDTEFNDFKEAIHQKDRKSVV